MTTVVVAARSASARARIESIVARTPGLRLVPASSATPLRRQVREARADIAVVDLDAEDAESILGDPAGGGGPRLILLAEVPRRVLARASLTRALLGGVLSRDAGPGELRAAIEAVQAGLVALHPDTLGAVRPRVPASLRGQPGQSLTAREVEVLGMLSEGLGNKAIAVRLDISTHTAKFHVASILAKLGAGSRTEAVAIGMRRGLVVI